MKILHILDQSLPVHSGYTFRSENLLKAQFNMGYEAIALTSPKHEQDLQGDSVEKEEINGFTYYRSGATPQLPGPLTSEAWLMLVLYSRILKVAKDERPDIIHAHSPVLNGIPALRAGHKLGIPVVYEIRAFWEDAAVDHGTCTESSLRYKVTKKLETMVCHKADHVAILCNGLKNDLISRNISANKITPVFNGVNTDDFKPCTPDDEYLRSWKLTRKKIVGFIGSFYRYEGLDLLVKAFAKISKKDTDAMLLLVGGGEMEGELKQLIADLKIEQQVLMPGRIPHHRVPGVYAMIDILAYPRYSMRLTELVTPLKPLEAMAMGKALIASDVGGHKELITHNKTGVLFKAGDEDTLATELSGLIEDDKKRVLLEQLGMQWVREHHSWLETTRVYQDIYEKVLGKSS